VLYPSLRIANLFYFLLGFRREYSIHRRVEHLVVFCGWALRGAGSILVLQVGSVRS